MATIEIKDPNVEKPITYYMDDKLKRSIDNKIIPSLIKKDKDCVIVLDGGEGVGKSTLALQIAKYIDPKLTLDNVVFDPESFRDRIIKAEKGTVVVYDESVTGFSSASALSPVNRVLKSLMMQMRQKNLCVLIIIPTFFLLDKYVALWRARSLIHVYENHDVRGYFRVYNRKKKRLLYILGKKTFSYAGKQWKSQTYTRFRGRFYGKFALGGEKEEQEYRNKKLKALQSIDKNPMTSSQVKFREQRDLLIWLLRKDAKFTYRKLANYLSDFDFDISHAQIRNICAKFGDKEAKDEQKAEKDLLDEDIEPNDVKDDEIEEF